jgi:ribonuclease P/MRP protein subunit RPP40
MVRLIIYAIKPNKKLMTETDTKPIMKLQPQVLESSPLRTKLEAIHTPSLQEMVSSDMSETDLQDRCGALSEWISMVQLGSACVSAGNEIDAYLSRYSVPDFTDKVTTDLISLKWHGLISSTWTMQLFLSLL